MTDQNIIQISGVPTLRKSVVPSIDVQLPLILTVKRRFYLPAGIFYAVMSMCFLLCVSTAFVPFPQDRPFLERAGLAGFQLISAWQAPYFLFAAWRTLRDALRADTRLMIDKDGITDARVGFSATWEDIRSVRQVNGSGNEWGVSLELRDPSLLPQSRWLRGFGWLPRRPNEIHIQTLGMSKRSYIARATIFRLVKAAGGASLPPRERDWLTIEK